MHHTRPIILQVSAQGATKTTKSAGRPCLIRGKGLGLRLARIVLLTPNDKNTDAICN